MKKRDRYRENATLLRIFIKCVQRNLFKRYRNHMSDSFVIKKKEKASTDFSTPEIFSVAAFTAQEQHLVPERQNYKS